MSDPPALSSIVPVIALGLLIVELAFLGGLRDLRRKLEGRRGHALATIVFKMVSVIIVAQLLTFVNACLIWVDARGTLDARIVVFVLIEMLQLAAVVWVFLEVRRLEQKA